MILAKNHHSQFMEATKQKKGLLDGMFRSHFWDTKATSANVKMSERILGYVVGPFGVMMLQSIVTVISTSI